LLLPVASVACCPVKLVRHTLCGQVTSLSLRSARLTPLPRPPPGVRSSRSRC
jgi:hypothetical protein